MFNRSKVIQFEKLKEQERIRNIMTGHDTQNYTEPILIDTKSYTYYSYLYEILKLLNICFAFFIITFIMANQQQFCPFYYKHSSSSFVF